MLGAAASLVAACGSNEQASPKVLHAFERASFIVERVVSAFPVAFAFDAVDGKL